MDKVEEIREDVKNGTMDYPHAAIDTLLAHIDTLQKEVDRLKEEVEKPKRTFCAYCGHEVEIDDEAATKISEHIMSCELHPMRIYEAALAEKEKECEGLKEQLDRLTALDKVAVSRYEHQIAELKTKLEAAEKEVETLQFQVENIKIDLERRRRR